MSAISVAHRGKIFDLKVAKVIGKTEEGKRLILSLHLDDSDPFEITDGAEFVTIFVPRIVVYDALIPPVGQSGP